MSLGTVEQMLAIESMRAENLLSHVRVDDISNTVQYSDQVGDLGERNNRERVHR